MHLRKKDLAAPFCHSISGQIDQSEAQDELGNKARLIHWSHPSKSDHWLWVKIGEAMDNSRLLGVMEFRWPMAMKKAPKYHTPKDTQRIPKGYERYSDNWSHRAVREGAKRPAENGANGDLAKIGFHWDSI